MMNLAFQSVAQNAVKRWLDTKLDDLKSALDWGAKADDAAGTYGAANDAARDAALTYCFITGGAVGWPHGSYTFAAPAPAFTGRQGKFRGDGRGAQFASNGNGPAGASHGTVFRADFVDGDLFTLGTGAGNSSCQFFEISDICFWPVKFRNGAEIRIAGASGCIFERLSFAYCDVAISFGPSAGCITRDVYAFNCYGGFVHSRGQAGIVNFSQGHYFERLNSYNVCEFTIGRCFTGWQPSRSQLLNDALRANGWIWACTQAGPTSASGAGPVAPAFTFAGHPLQTDVADGGAKWRPICRESFTPFLMDSYSLMLTLAHSELLQGYNGVAMVDSVGSGSAPTHLVLDNVMADHEFGDCFAFLAGQNVRGRDAKATISAGGRGYYFGTSFVGDATFRSGEAWACALEGIKQELGPENIKFIGTDIGGNGAQDTGTIDGVDIAGARVRLIGCRIGPLQTGAGAQRYGVRLRSTATKATIKACDLAGNATGPLLDESNTATNIIESNDGLPTNQAAITVGASPFAWTNKTGRAASVIVYNGTVSMVQLNGVRVGTATDISVCVPRGQTVTVTYSAAPSMAQSPIT